MATTNTTQALGIYICAGNHAGCLFSATTPTCPVVGCQATVEYCGRDTAANRAAMQTPGPLAWIGETEEVALVNYSTLCAPCRETGVVSVERTAPPAMGCCALCGESIPALVAALLQAPGARPCRDCRGVCLPEVPCTCCRELAAMQDELAWEA